MTISISKPVSLQSVRALSDLLDGCGYCEHDEAEGGVINHCDACCRKVARWANENWMGVALAEASIRKPQPDPRTAALVAAARSGLDYWQDSDPSPRAREACKALRAALRAFEGEGEQKP